MLQTNLIIYIVIFAVLAGLVIWAIIKSKELLIKLMLVMALILSSSVLLLNLKWITQINFTFIQKTVSVIMLILFGVYFIKRFNDNRKANAMKDEKYKEYLNEHKEEEE